MDMEEHDAAMREIEAQRVNGIEAPPPAYSADGKPLPPRGYVPSVTPF